MPRDAESESLLLALKELDESDNEVTYWEAGFINGILKSKYSGPLSERQKAVIYDMCYRYNITP